MKITFDKNINLLKEEIESYLSWGNGRSWTNKDFEKLSHLILIETEDSLSVSTLKRFWGRTEQKARPSVTTLDILSKFVGYKSWRTFLKEKENKADVRKTSFLFKKYLRYGMIGIPIFVLLVIILSNIDAVRPSVNDEILAQKFDAVEFDFEKVTSGYPNTVIFKYDVKDLVFDSLSIQQSWDKSKRIALQESKGVRTTTYLFPGYFLTKLIWNDRIIKERQLYIPTKGWQGAVVRNNGEIHYFENEIAKEAHQITTEYEEQEDDKSLYLAYLSNQPSINGSNFKLNSSFMVKKPFDHSTCVYSRIIITGTKEVVSLNFSVPGCVGSLNSFINQKYISGAENDLSGFGIEKDKIIRCSLSMNDNVLDVFVEEEKIFSDTLVSDIGLIGGVQFWFDGIGSVYNLEIQDENNRVNYLD